MKKLFFAIIALFVSSFSFGQVVTIGTGTEHDDGIPIDPYFKYSYSQCLYLASEINQTGNIYRIKYKGASGLSLSNSSDWTVYIGHTTNTTLTNNTWIPVSSMTQVFTGTITEVNDNVEITLTTPFNYNGTDNLVIAIDENQDGLNGSNHDFLSSNVTGQRSLLFRNDNNNPDPANPPSNTIGQSAVANIDLDFNATVCSAPTAISATNITTSSADISWTAGGTETTWNIEYGVSGFAQGSGTMITGVTTSSQALSVLTPGTTYDVYLQSDCGSGATSAWTESLSFSTACLPITVFSEDFEGIATYTLPNCWSGLLDNGTGTTASIGVYSYASPHSGTGHVRLSNGNSPSTSNIILVSPQVSNLGAGTHRLRFYAKNSGSTAQDLEVGTITSPTDGSTFTSLQSVDINGTYTEYIVNFNNYSGSDQYIAIRRLSTFTYNSVLLDDIIWEPIPSCLAPSALTANNIIATSADLGWTENGSATSWQIEYGVTGFTQGTGTSSIVTTNPVNVSSLNPDTDYDFYVRAVCSAGDSSIWRGPFQFTTLCSAFTTLPFVESFENITTGQPDCWGIAGTTTNNNYHWNGTSSGETGRGIRFNSRYNPNGRTSELTTPILDLTSLTQAQLTFFYKNATGGNFEVLISNDGGTTYTSLEDGLTGQTDWTEKTYDITSNISNNVIIQFKGTSNHGSGSAYVYLDSVVVRQTPSCLAPSALTANNIIATSADLGWTENGSATSWQVEYGATGFTQGTGTRLIAAANPVNVSSLNPDTDYDFYVRAVCGVGDSSIWRGPFQFTTPCNAFTTLPFVESFENITTGQPNCWRIAGTTTNNNYNWNGTSSGETGRGIRFDSFHNPSGKTSELTTPILNLTPLTQAQLKFFYKNPTGGNFEVLISNDGGTTYTSLEDGLTGQNNWTEKTYDITSNISNNVIIQFKATSNYGSGIAYVYLDSVVVRQTPSCVVPTSTTTDNIAATSVDLSWTAGGSGGTSWQVEYGATGFTQGTGTSIVTSTNPHTLSALSPETTYDWYVREICGAGDTSVWTSVNTFTTACVAITNFNENFDGTPTNLLPNCWNRIIDNGASSSAKVEVSTFSTAHSGSKHIRMYNVSSPASSNIILVSPLLSNLSAGTHRLRFYAKNTSATQDIEIGTVSHPTDGSTFNSLQSVDINSTYTEYIVNFNAYSGTDQYIAIRRNSTVNYTTVYLDDIVWETIPSCVKPTNLTINNIATTSVDLSWASGSSGTSWQIEYGATGFTQGTGTTVITSSNPHSLSGLTANTSYDWYVREICGAGDTSVWTSVNTFTTACGIVTAFNESFEGATTPNLPSCWGKILDNGVSSYAQIKTATSSNAVSGTKHVKLYNSSSADTSNIILVSPQVSNLSAGTHQLRFYAKNTSSVTQDLEVGTVTDPTDGSTFTSLESVDIDGTYTEYIVNFSSYSGTDQYIAIRRLSTHNYSNVWLDDIVWEVIPSCPQPLTSSLDTSNVTTTSAELSWTAGGTETTWSIEYGTVGFTQGTGTTIATITTNSYSLTGLTGTSSYDFYVRGICGAGDSSTWAGPFTFSTACATVTTFPFVEEFEAITTGQPTCWGISGTTTSANFHWFSHPNGSQGRGIRFNSFSNASGNTSELTTPLIDLSSLSTAELKFDYKNPTGGPFEVLISTDGGTTYTSLESGLTGQTDWTEKTYNITSYIGNNVKIQFKGTSNYANGDAYVYLDSVVVDGTQIDCDDVSDLSVSNITENSVTLGWTENGAATSWEIEWGEEDFTLGQGTLIQSSNTQNTYNLFGLQEDTEYEFYVRSICNSNLSSNWVGPFEFETEETSGLLKKSIDLVKVYPNPVHDVLNIENKLNVDYKVEIFDMTGQKVFSGKNNSTINVEKFNKGIYQLRISKTESIQNERILID